MSEPHLHTAPDPDFADIDALALALDQLAPGAAPSAPLKRIGAGFFSTAVETASGVVFRLGLAPGEAAMVGDSVESDIAGGRGAGMRTVLYAPAGAPAGTADVVVRSWAELARLAGVA